jgi:hypothetical protein
MNTAINSVPSLCSIKNKEARDTKKCNNNKIQLLLNFVFTESILPDFKKIETKVNNPKIDRIMM